MFKCGMDCFYLLKTELNSKLKEQREEKQRETET